MLSSITTVIKTSLLIITYIIKILLLNISHIHEIMMNDGTFQFTLKNKYGGI